MVKLLECLKSLFGTSDLYEVLQIEKDAPGSEVKKAYYKMSLQVHPDRVAKEERPNATKKFQSISQVYDILSNTEKRALYDESGEIDENTVILEENRDWDSYWRILFNKITIAEIEKFHGEYRHSEEENRDVIAAYIECKGDIDAMLEKIPCSTVEDVVRFKEIIDVKIKQGDIPFFDAFKKENAKAQAKRQKMVCVNGEMIIAKQSPLYY